MPGTFSWRWERLLPGNLTAYRYSLCPLSFAGGRSGRRCLRRSCIPPSCRRSPTSPSGRSPNWSSRSVPRACPRLLRDEHLYPENLPEYYRGQADALGAALVELAAGAGPGPRRRAGSPRALARQSWPPAFPAPGHPASGAAGRCERPDSGAVRTGAGILPQPGGHPRSGARRGRERAGRRSGPARPWPGRRESASLQSLAAYGELLNKYPVLLKAMYVQNLSGKELATVPGFDLDRVLSGLEPR